MVLQDEKLGKKNKKLVVVIVAVALVLVYASFTVFDGNVLSQAENPIGSHKINTECELLYFLHKDPLQKAVLIQFFSDNEGAAYEKVVERLGNPSDYDMQAHRQLEPVLYEILTDMMIEEFSINPSLKESIIFKINNELPQSEIEQIRDGTHLCEKEMQK